MEASRGATLMLGLIVCWLGVATSQKLCSPRPQDPFATSLQLAFIETSDMTDDAVAPQSQQLLIHGTVDTEIQLSLAQTADNAYFQLNGKTLTLVRPLDRESVPAGLNTLDVQVLCRDIHTNRQRTIVVTVTVTDRNDNAPRFVHLPYHVEINELTPVGTTVFRMLSAVDADKSANGLVNFEVEQGDGSVLDASSYFAINLPYQGFITIRRPLDYESLQSTNYTLDLIVTAVDQARPPETPLRSRTYVRFTVTDGNDLSPTFVYEGCEPVIARQCINPQYAADIQSNVAAGALTVMPEPIRAVDADDINNPVTYSFVSGTRADYAHYFSIDERTGVVTQTVPISRGDTDKVILLVQAQEMTSGVAIPGRFSVATLTVHVTAVNSHDPVLELTGRVGFVEENAPVGTVVRTDRDESAPGMRITAYDPDLSAGDGTSGLRFLLSSQGDFRLNSDGIVVVNRAGLDADSPPTSYVLDVVAQETGENARQSQKQTFSVTLMDVNDNAPVFERTFYDMVTLPEGPGPRDVIKVAATDHDSEAYGDVMYAIVHVSAAATDKFSINPQSGLIQVLPSAVMQRGATYSITVQAADGAQGAMQRVSQAIVEVTVQASAAQSAPYFEIVNYTVAVSEGTPVGTPLVKLQARDLDGDTVSYEIYPPNTDFAVDADTGVVTIQRPLDYEKLSVHHLSVRANDRKTMPMSSVSVTVRVLDQNDNNPLFEESRYSFSVNEGLRDAVVGTVRAMDVDTGSRIRYVIIEGSSQSPFVIDAVKGEMRTAVALDYETQREHVVMVTAVDSAGSAARSVSVPVVVNVVDVADELPIFKTRRYSAVVSENVADALVTRVQATDPDTVDDITYVIRNGDTERFRIDARTGEVRTRTPLDYDAGRSHYTLVIGTQQNPFSAMATTEVNITVRDENDFTPAFSQTFYVVYVTEASPVGTLVTRVSADDADRTEHNSRVEYRITGYGHAPDYFYMLSDGAIVTKDSLLNDRSAGTYTVGVEAFNPSQPDRSGATNVTVVIQRNTSVPTAPPTSEKGFDFGFGRDLYMASVEENAASQAHVISVPVINRWQSRRLVCDIESGDTDDKFTAVSDDTGCIVLTNTLLDRERIPSYSLRLRATYRSRADADAEPVAMTTVVVTVLDRNDKAPTFVFDDAALTGERYYGVIERETPPYEVIVHTQAVDSDSSDNARVTYSLHDVPYDYFTVERDTGTIRNVQQLSLVAAPADTHYKFSVVATDSPADRQDALTSRAEVIVNVLRDDHLMALVVTGLQPQRVQRMREGVRRVLQDQTGYVVGIHRIENRRYRSDDVADNSVKVDLDSADVWFYVTDPETGRLLNRSQIIAAGKIFTEEQQQQLRQSFLSAPQPMTAAFVRAPVVTAAKEEPAAAAARTYSDISNWQAALIALACLIVLVCLLALVAICCLWAGYKKHRDQVKRLQVVPRYEPVYIDAPFETKPQIPPTYAEPQVAPPYPEPPNVAPPHVAPPHVAPPYPEHIHGYETQELGMFVPEGDTSAHTDPNSSYRPTTPPNPNVTYGPPQTTTTTTMAGARVQPPDQRKDIPYVETALEQKIERSTLDEPYYEATLGGSTDRADSGAGSTEGAFARVSTRLPPSVSSGTSSRTSSHARYEDRQQLIKDSGQNLNGTSNRLYVSSENAAGVQLSAPTSSSSSSSSYGSSSVGEKARKPVSREESTTIL